MTNAGKPVYSANGDIYILAPIFATLYAILSKHQTFSFKQQKKKAVEEVFRSDRDFFGTDTLGNRRSQSLRSKPEQRPDANAWIEVEESNEPISEIQSIKTFGGNLKFIFLTKGECLIYIALSRQKDESESFLKK